MKEKYVVVFMRDGTTLDFEGQCNQFDYGDPNYVVFNHVEGEIVTPLSLVAHHAINHIYWET